MAEDGKVVYKVVVDSTGATSEAERAGQRIGAGVQAGASGSGTSLGTKVGRAMTVAAATAVAGGAKLITGALKEGMDFDSAMSQVAATLGYSVEELSDKSSAAAQNFQKLRDFALQMGAKTVFTSTEAAEALNYMALAGYDAEKSIRMLPTVLNLAAAGGMDLARASDVVTDISSALQLSEEETIAMIDQMARASSRSNTSVAQLGEAMLKLGPIGQQLRGGTLELATVYGILADNGVKGAEAGTHLRNILTSLAKPTETAALALDELGINAFDENGKLKSFIELMPEFRTALQGSDMTIREMMDATNTDTMDDLMAVLETMSDADIDNLFGGLTNQKQLELLSSIFNKRDLASVLALINTSSDRWAELWGEIDNSSGAAEDMARTQLDNLKGDVTLLQSAWSNFKINLSDKMADSLRALMPRIMELIEHLTEVVNNMDWDKITEKVGGLIEKIFNLVEYILTHTDEVEGLIKSAAGAFLAAKGAGWLGKAAGFFGGGAAAGAAGGAAAGGATAATAGIAAAAAPVAVGVGSLALGGLVIKSRMDELGSEGYLGDGHTLEEYAANVDDYAAKLAAFTETYGAKGENVTTEGWDMYQFEKETFETGLRHAQEELAGAQEAAEAAASGVDDTLGGISEQAHGWGVDMMSAFAGGMTEGANGVLFPTAIGLAAGLAALFHHSEPDVGPLAGDSQWMPDMMRSMAAGIDEYGYLVTDQLAALGGDMAAVAPTLGGYERSVGGQIAGGAGGLMQITVPVSIDGTEVARATAWAMGQQMAWEAL